MQSVSPRDLPCPDGGIGRRAGLKIQCPLKTCGFEPRSGHEKGSLEGAFLVPCSAACRGLGTLHVTPPLNPLPRGGDSAAKAAVRLLAQSLRSESASIQGQYNTKWALTPTPQRHHYLRYSSPCHLLFFKALYLRGVTKRVTARGILIRASCQFRLYKCLIPKRFLSP